MFLIKSAKKFSFEPKVKDQKIKLVCESSFLCFWRNELCIIYDASWNQGHIQGKIKQWNIWERSTFLKKVKILLLVCSIKQYSFENSLDNSGIQILFFNLSLLFGTKGKKIPQRYFPLSPQGRIPPTPSCYLKSPDCGNIWKEFCWTFTSS